MTQSKAIARVFIYRAPTQPRRLVAAGLIRRSGGRTTRITITPAGATGSIRPDDNPTPGGPSPVTSALHTSLTAPEPDRPECHICGNRRGPWLPDPSGIRWPSGAQMLICSRGCPTQGGDGQ